MVNIEKHGDYTGYGITNNDITSNPRKQWEERFKPKEVKKVKKKVDYKKLPYLEMKVVKVKKEKQQHYKRDNMGLSDDEVINIIKHSYSLENMTKKIKEYLERKHSKGNWVNGENLDKIKFPVPCSYIEEGIKHIGMLNCYVDQYRLYNIEKQSKDNFVDDCTSLKHLINSYNIHILKGKVIIFEETNE